MLKRQNGDFAAGQAVPEATASVLFPSLYHLPAGHQRSDVASFFVARFTVGGRKVVRITDERVVDVLQHGAGSVEGRVVSESRRHGTTVSGHLPALRGPSGIDPDRERLGV